MKLNMKIIIMAASAVVALVVIAGLFLIFGPFEFNKPTSGRVISQKGQPGSPTLRPTTTTPSTTKLLDETDENLKKMFVSLLSHAKRSKGKGIPKGDKAIALIAQLNDELIARLSSKDTNLAQNLKSLKPLYELYKKAIPIICKDVSDSPKMGKVVSKHCPPSSATASKDISRDEYDFINNNRANLDSLGVPFPSQQHIRNFLMRHTTKTTPQIIDEFEQAYSEYLSKDYSDDRKIKTVSLYDDLISRLTTFSSLDAHPKYKSKPKFVDYAFVTLKKDFEDAYLKYRTSNPGKEETDNKPAAIQAFLRLKPFSSVKHPQVSSAKTFDEYLPEVDFFPSLLKDRIQKFEESSNNDSLISARKAYKEYKDRLAKHVNDTRQNQSTALQQIPESDRKAIQIHSDFDEFFHRQAMHKLTLVVNEHDVAKIDSSLQCVRLVTKSGNPIKSILDNASSTSLLADIEEISKAPTSEEEFQKILNASKAIHYAMKEGTEIFVKTRITLEAFRGFFTYCNDHNLWEENKQMIKDMISSYLPFFPDLTLSDIGRFNILPSKIMLSCPDIKPKVYLKLFPMQDLTKCMNDPSKCAYWADIPASNLQSNVFLESPDVLALLYSHDGINEPRRLPEPWMDYLLKTKLPLELSSLPVGPLKPFMRARYLCNALLWMFQVQQAVFWEVMHTEQSPKLTQLKERYLEVLLAVEDFDWEFDMRESDDFIEDKLRFTFEKFAKHLEANYAEVLMEKKYYERQRNYFNAIDSHKQIILDGFKAPLFELTKASELANALGLNSITPPTDLNSVMTSLLDLFYLAAEPLEVIKKFELLDKDKNLEQYHANWLYRIRAPLIMLTGPQIYVRKLRQYIHRMNEYAAVTDYKPFVKSNDWGTIYYGVKKGTLPQMDTNLSTPDVELILSSLLTWGESWVNLFQCDEKLLTLAHEYRSRNNNEGQQYHLKVRSLNAQNYPSFTNVNRVTDTNIRTSLEGYVEYITGPTNLDNPKFIPIVTYLKQNGEKEPNQGGGIGMQRMLMAHLNIMFKFLTYHDDVITITPAEVMEDKYMSKDVFGLGPQHHADFYKVFATLIGKNVIMGAPMQVFVHPDLWEWLMTLPTSPPGGPVEKEFEGYEYDWLLWFPQLSLHYDPIYFWASDMSLVPKAFKVDGSPESLTDFVMKPLHGSVDNLVKKTAYDWFDDFTRYIPKDYPKSYDKLNDVVQCHLKYFMKRMIQGRNSFQKRIQEYFKRNEPIEKVSKYSAHECIADMDSLAHLSCQLFPLDAEKMAEAVERNVTDNSVQYWVRDSKGNVMGAGPAIAQIMRDFGKEEGRYAETSMSMSQALLKGFLALFNGRPTLPSDGYSALRFSFSYGGSETTFTGIKAAVCSAAMYLPHRKPKIEPVPPSSSTSSREPPKGEPVTATQPIEYEDLYNVFKMSCLSCLESGDAIESYAPSKPRT